MPVEPTSLRRLIEPSGLNTWVLADLTGIPQETLRCWWDDDHWLEFATGRRADRLTEAVPAIRNYVEAQSAARRTQWATDLAACGVAVERPDDLTTAQLLTLTRDLPPGEITRAFQVLRPRYRAIVRAWLGIDGGRQTHRHVGEQFGITRERVRQIVTSSARPLKRNRDDDPAVRVVLNGITSRQRPVGPRLDKDVPGGTMRRAR